MVNLSITANRNEVLQRVSLKAAYLGKKSGKGDGSQYEQLSLVDTDDEFFNEPWLAVISLLCQVCRPYIVSKLVYGDDVLRLDLHMPRNWDYQEHAMHESAQVFMVNYLLAKWCEMIDANLSAALMQVATEQLELMRSQLAARSFPKREILTPKLT